MYKLSFFNILLLLLSSFLLFPFVCTSNCILEYQQCGGFPDGSPPKSCCSPLKCIFINNYYSQCQYIEGTNCMPRQSSCITIDEHDPLYQCCPDLICVKYNDYDKRCTLPINNILCVEQNHQCGGISNILGVEWNQAMECCPGLSCKGESTYYQQCLP